MSFPIESCNPKTYDQSPSPEPSPTSSLKGLSRIASPTLSTATTVASLGALSRNVSQTPSPSPFIPPRSIIVSIASNQSPPLVIAASPLPSLDTVRERLLRAANSGPDCFEFQALRHAEKFGLSNDTVKTIIDDCKIAWQRYDDQHKILLSDPNINNPKTGSDYIASKQAEFNQTLEDKMSWIAESFCKMLD